MKRIFKIALVALLIIFIIIQFFRPPKNRSTGLSTNDMTSGLTVPPKVQDILKHSCYDCHSNNTRYPWYFNIQPVAWWLNDHIKKGKRELNFSEFKNYKVNRQYKKLEELIEEVETEEMPLYSYTLIHRSANLNDEQKTLIIIWSKSVMQQLKVKYPPDSFTKR